MLFFFFLCLPFSFLVLQRLFKSIGKKVTNFHFNGRVKENGGRKVPTYAEVTAEGSGWTLLPTSMSIFHDNKKVRIIF